MKRFTKNILSTIALGLTTAAVVAQPANEFFLKSLPQAFYLNPGQMPEGNGHIGFLGFGHQAFSATSSGFKFSDVMTDSIISLSALNPDSLSTIKENNYLGLGFRKDFFNLGWGWKEKNYWSLVGAFRMNIDFNYSSDFLSVLTQGNGAPQFLNGNPVDLDGTRYNITLYNEFGIGYARKVNDNLTIGGKLKYLQGLGNFNGNFDGIKITTSQDLTSLTIQSALSVQSATPLDTSGAFDQSKAMSNGKGFGMDLGGSYKINDQITAYASVVDFGIISWGSGKTLSNNDVTFTFNGFSYAEFTDTTAENDAFTELADSIQEVFKLDEKEGSYTTYLPARFFVGGSYEITDVWNANLLYSGTLVNGQLLNTAIVGVGLKASKWFEAKLSYTIANNTYTNIGFGSVLNLGALQLYFVTDNILGLFQADYANHMNGSAGANLTFGRKKQFDAMKAKKNAPDMPATSDSTKVDMTPTMTPENSVKENVDKMEKEADEKVEDAKDEAKEDKKDAKEDAKDAKDDADDAKDEAKDAKEDAKDAQKDAKREAKKAIEKAEDKAEKSAENAEKRAEKAEQEADEAARKMKEMEAAKKAAAAPVVAPAVQDSAAKTPAANIPQDTTATPDLVPVAPAQTDSTGSSSTVPNMDDLNKVVEEIKQEGENVEKALPSDVEPGQ